MKKITLWLSFVLIMSFTATNAQQDFETATVGSLPAGWTSAQSASDDPGFTVQNESGYAHAGSSQYLAHLGTDIASESTSWVVSSAQTIGSAYELRFFWRGKWSTAYNYTGVYVSTASNDPVANPGDFTLLEELSPANYPDTWLQWNEAAYDLSAYTGQVYIAFKYIGDHAHDFYIDDLDVAPIPYCDIPGNFDVNNRYTDSLDISWSGVVGYDNYEVVWGAPGFDPNAAGVTPTQVTGTTYTITGLAPSTRYEIYLRTVCSSYNYSSWIGPKMGYTDGPPPANNDCNSAEVLTVYPFGGSSGNEIMANTLNATDSGMHPSCDTTGTNIDLYYTFTVPVGATSGVQVITGGNTGGDIEAALYDACGGIELDCQGESSIKMFRGLTEGATYTLQVWHDDFNAGDFTISIEMLPPPPTNDLCSGAEMLTVYSEGGLPGNETLASTTWASDSGFHPTCDTYGTNLDLYYTFTVPVGATGVQVITGGNTGDDIEAALYDVCGGIELDCQGTGTSKIFGGLIEGTTYVLQVWHDDFNAGDFTIGVEMAPMPPANDLCSGAIPLTVYNSLQTITGNNMVTTDSGEVSPGCGNYSGGDIWYSVVVPASGTVTVESASVAGSSVSDTGIAVYSGACGSLSLVECNDDGGAGYFSLISVSGVTPGETLYIRVWEYGNNSFGEIAIGAYDASVSVSDNIIEGFDYYPNPVTNMLNVSARADIQNITIFDISGKQVITTHPNSLETRIDFSSLKSGIYFVKAKVAGNITAFKIIKK